MNTSTEIGQNPNYDVRTNSGLRTNRSLLKFILLSIITFGIYGIVVYSHIGEEINMMASPHDGKKTMHFCLLFFIVAPLTLGIANIVWFCKISNRIGDELSRRGINYEFDSNTYWGWGFFGVLIIIGPFIYLHKLLKSMNLLCENYNANGGF